MTTHKSSGTASKGSNPALDAGFSSTTGAGSSTTTTGPPASAEDATRDTESISATDVFMVPPAPLVVVGERYQQLWSSWPDNSVLRKHYLKMSDYCTRFAQSGRVER